MKKNLAKFIRILTIPPFMVSILLLNIYFNPRNVFIDKIDLLIAFLSLMIIPIIAYPFVSMVPSLRKNKRENQRKYAFYFSIVGYSLGTIYSFASSGTMDAILIYLTYFLSVILLFIINKVTNVRASGHSSALCGPMILICYFEGIRYIIPCIILFAGVVWSSLTLKRHSLKDLIVGGLCPMVAFIISFIVIK